MRSVRLVTLVAALGLWGCSTSPAGPDASADGGSDVIEPEVGAPEGGDAAYDGPVVTPLCTFPADAGAGTGSCITVTLDGGNLCNPVTNAGCDVDAGEACDFTAIGFGCYGPTPPNTATACMDCDDKLTACVPTETCAPTAGGLKCARFCCVDGDCGSGHCDMTTFDAAAVGICVQ